MIHAIAIAGLLISALGALGGLTAAFGYRLGFMGVRMSLLTVLTYSAYAAAGGAVISLVALIALFATRKRRASTSLGTSRAVVMAAAGVLIGAVVFAIPARMRYESQRNGYPPIHDISTDTEDPPAFVDVLPLRAKAPNTVKYGGARIATAQKKAYPDVVPTTLSDPPDRAFDRALDAVNAMGWELVSADRKAQRIEATDTTFWFGFKDDVVIRLRPDGNGTRVDVRSLSRVGGGDVGTNAKRIRAYLARLKT